MRTINKPILTFVACNDTMGDGVNPGTMDYFMGQRFPWLSLAIPKLRDIGYDVEVVSWQNKAIDWPSKKFVIFGPVWGYSNYPEEFDAWLTFLQKNKIIIHNSIEFLRWNFRKTYLLDLQKGDINIPSTIIVDPHSSSTLQDIIWLVREQWKTGDIIIKGVVDAGAFGYKHVKSGTIGEFEKHFNDLKLKNSGVVVQPFLPEIMRIGEYAFVFFNENLSHGFLKVPASGEERVQIIYNGKSFHFKDDNIVDRKGLTAFRPDIMIPLTVDIQSARDQVIEIRRKLSKLLQNKGINPPLYVRIDGVMIDGKFIVMEIEGFEPYMELKESAIADPNNNAVDKYVQAINLAYRERLDRIHQ